MAEAAAEASEDAAVTFVQARAAAYAAAGRPTPEARDAGPDVPGLTESWFCCAEPTAGQLAALSLV